LQIGKKVKFDLSSDNIEKLRVLNELQSIIKHNIAYESPKRQLILKPKMKTEESLQHPIEKDNYTYFKFSDQDMTQMNYPEIVNEIYDFMISEDNQFNDPKFYDIVLSI
jgi:hypothetical protein